ncbi:MAG: class I SAM-dependent methyltransferase [Candidatus Eisenbacteria bacterium]|uniref:Class I SAM-dependent methyltransferase n=1 Tax=Eiseniibacteriota bacterium TaxID=2212470 RepID=A0A948RTS9_UNCEI|nr:class I SAM-dependent methyltransferase [Candidatus Eisenbacteria bacterium]MBU1947678.1 class I SAM-dependent methyltransferase [Candidatus Eisenbacteria bacterium]MBU2690875.1 class I SAM-dependent methyltransferase [Candidatus Eisenbacteria bacterium]
MKRTKNDRALRFYSEVLGLERIHYGLWLPEDELSLENLKKAQIRYEDLLIEQIPSDAKSILDVGCGTGVMSSKLKELGYNVEGLSPDINQQEVFATKVDAPFHFCCFEEFTPQKKYDVIIMSESAQYIPLPLLFKTAAQALTGSGVLIISDYFVNKEATGKMAKSGHRYELFLAEAESNNFAVMKNEDITDGITKTLDIGKLYVDKILLTVNIFSERFVIRHPHVTRLALWLGRNKIKSGKEEMQLIDSKQFKANKAYRLIVFRSGGEGVS